MLSVSRLYEHKVSGKMVQCLSEAVTCVFNTWSACLTRQLLQTHRLKCFSSGTARHGVQRGVMSIVTGMQQAEASSHTGDLYLPGCVIKVSSLRVFLRAASGEFSGE